MLKKLFNWIRTPSKKWSLGILVFAGIAIGILSTVSFQTTMSATSTELFCGTACHEMSDNVTKEFVGTVHDSNPSGVRATCADCHVPKEFVPKMVRKIKATREVYHHLLGTYDTPEKFEEHRAVMAQRVWDEMKANDSQSCRNCHTRDKMLFAEQSEMAAQMHKMAPDMGRTCIDCHKGIAHKLPNS